MNQTNPPVETRFWENSRHHLTPKDGHEKVALVVFELIIFLINYYLLKIIVKYY